MSPSLSTPSRLRLSAEARRDAILAAAKRVFGRSGYHAATVRDVAAEAGVSEALLYQHFEGKRHLFMEVVTAAAADLEARLLAVRAAGDPDAAVAAYFDFVEQESGLYRVFFRQGVQADPMLQDLHRRLWARFIRLMREAQPLSEAGAHALAGMMNELALWWLEEGRLGKEELVRRACRMAAALCDSEVEHGTGDQGPAG
ncbi:MAG TPA: TetR/AcrR family transcriptional regulator [Candidatus Dormibacteraeota bacterium]|jgi:AcrR family transcriptional regulator|nr:TetR/AcrR family transcriptional regulator [Candidatus Dormibacteraeota bacterium]